MEEGDLRRCYLAPHKPVYDATTTPGATRLLSCSCPHMCNNPPGPMMLRHKVQI